MGDDARHNVRRGADARAAQRSPSALLVQDADHVHGRHPGAIRAIGQEGVANVGNRKMRAAAVNSLPLRPA